MGPDKHSLFSKEETEEEKPPSGVFCDSPTPISRLMPQQCPSNRHLPANHQSPQEFLLSMMLHGTEYPCSQLGPAVPSQLLAHPSLLTRGVLEALTLCH